MKIQYVETPRIGKKFSDLPTGTLFRIKETFGPRHHQSLCLKTALGKYRYFNWEGVLSEEMDYRYIAHEVITVAVESVTLRETV